MQYLPVLSEIFPFQWEENATTNALSGTERYEVMKNLVTAMLSKWGEGKFSGLVIENLQWMHEESWSLLTKVVKTSNLAFVILTMRFTTSLPSHLLEVQASSNFVDYVVECEFCRFFSSLSSPPRFVVWCHCHCRGQTFFWIIFVLRSYS